MFAKIKQIILYYVCAWHNYSIFLLPTKKPASAKDILNNATYFN